MAAIYALIAALCWTAASQLYACVTRTLNVRRVNFLKAIISFSLFALLSYLVFPSQDLRHETIFWLSVSGIFGFALGDLCLFYTFAKIGPARTLMLAGFGPTIIAATSYFLFQESFPHKKIWGLIIMFFCLYFLSKEREASNKWNKKILLIGLCGIILDSFGVAMSKHAFSLDHTLNPSQANFYRILAALPVLTLVYWKQEKFPVRPITKRELAILSLAAFLGTFLALFCYLKALSLENAAIVASISLSSPIFSSIYEHLRDHHWPKPQFIGALLLMIVSVWILI